MIVNMEDIMIEEAVRDAAGQRPRLTAAQVESAVRAAQRGGIRVRRVTVDHKLGRIEIEAAADDAMSLRSFDTIDFRPGP